MTQHLHISIGPVQSFVAQSRRTRDLWGGSYLLSLLAAHAMRGATRAGGEIIRPRVDGDPLFKWVSRGEDAPDAPPRLGSLPNQFTVELKGGQDPAVVANAAERAFRAGWERVCCAVWDKYLAEAARREGQGTEVIWRRQTSSFWELVWVAGNPGDHGLLQRRKLWRTHRLPEEAGDKCTVIPELQELSGYLRAAQSKPQDAFWAALRKRLGELELRERERLCAIAFVKRLYARVPEAIGGQLDVTRWPSTVDVAAVLWARGAFEAAPQEANDLADTVVKASSEGALTGGVSSLVPGEGRARLIGANWFHRSFVASARLAPLRDEADREVVLARLTALTEHPDGVGGKVGSPPIYYALLLADGDHLGELVRALGGEVVSRPLSRFTAQVPDIVRVHDGCAIYAGGDDVLAVLPIQRALGCAREIEQAYQRAFDPERPALGAMAATLSAAIVFAHARTPLNRVLTEAHRLLDDEAKAENGRASLAAGVYRGEAPAVQWVTTWERPALGGGSVSATTCVETAAREMASAGASLSSSLLHDLRHMLGRLCGDASIAPGSFAQLGGGIDVSALVRAEIEHRLAHRDEDRQPDELDRLVAIVVELLGRAHRTEPAEDQYGMDGLLLASFLANDGREDEHRS